MHLIPKYIIDPRVWTLVHQESVRKTPTTSNNQELPRITNIGSKSPVFPQHCTAHWDSYETATGLQDGVLVPSEVIAGNMAIKTMSDKQCQNCQNTMKHYENTMNPVCSNVVKLSSRACHVRRLVLHGTSGAIPAAFLYTDLYALGVAKSTDQALVVVFLATLTCSMVGMDSAIISFISSFIRFYMILVYSCIFHRRIHVSSDGAEKLQMSHMGMIHGWVGRFLSKRAIRLSAQMEDPTCWSEPRSSDLDLHHLTSPKAAIHEFANVNMLSGLFFDIQESEVMIVGPWGGSDVETKSEWYKWYIPHTTVAQKFESKPCRMLSDLHHGLFWNWDMESSCSFFSQQHSIPENSKCSIAVSSQSVSDLRSSPWVLLLNY